MDVHVWHGQNRFNLYEALCPDEVEYVDDDDEQEDIESPSDEEDEDILMVGETGSEAEEGDGDEWKPKGMSKKAEKIKPKDKKKKIQVVVTSYGVLVSEHAKHEKSVRKSESSIFESSSINLGATRLLILATS